MVNDTCIVATHLSKLALTILLLLTATQLYGIEWGLIRNSCHAHGVILLTILSKWKMVVSFGLSTHFTSLVPSHPRPSGEGYRWLGTRLTFHIHDSSIVSMQYSYTFSSINVPYSVGEEKSIRKTGHEVRPSGRE